MNSLQQIAIRRATLIKRAAQERAELGAVCGQFQRPVALFDKGYAIASKIKEHPGIAMGATAALSLILLKRGTLGSLIGVATKAAKFAMPVARFWLARKRAE
jgi:hypothetical protein